MIDFLRELFFESRPMLLAFEVIAIGLTVAIHRRRLTRGSKRAVWITLAVCAGLLVMQSLVVTDQEAIEVLVRALTRAAQEGDVPGIAAHVDASFHGGRKKEFVEMCNQRLQERHIEAARLNALAMTVSGDEADVRFRVFCDIRGQGEPVENVPSYWRIQCVRSAGEWMLQDIKDAQVGPGIFTTQGGMRIMSYLQLGRD